MLNRKLLIALFTAAVAAESIPQAIAENTAQITQLPLRLPTNSIFAQALYLRELMLF